MLNELPAYLSAIVIAFLIVLAIAWLLLPFAMFGMKPRLDQLITETKRTNELLERLKSQRDE